MVLSFSFYEITYSKTLLITLFRGDQVAILTLKTLTGICPWFLIIIPGSCPRHVNSHAFFLHPMRGGQWRKSTNDIEGSRYRNYNTTSRTILRISRISGA
jgi:hypothetical protein